VPKGALSGRWYDRCGASDRNIKNTRLVQELLSSRGFDVTSFNPGPCTIRETVAVLRHARFVIGVHGAAMSNVAFMQPHSTVLELFPYGKLPSEPRWMA
jgi:capsular polysaccharide biosynthesis protein